MGMDVYGKSPSAPAGEYFQCSIWTWAGGILPTLQAAAKRCGIDTDGWEYNDGHGLPDQRACDQLAAEVEALRAAGKPLVVEPNPTGAPERFRAMFGLGPDVYAGRDRLADFVQFLRACGGFEIQ